MASFSYNGINLEDYGVTVVSAGRDPMSHKFDSMQLEDKAYSWESRLQPLLMSLEIVVIAMKEDVYTVPPVWQLSIRKLMPFLREVLNEREDCQLILSTMDDRFWLARFQSLNGGIIAPGHFRGTIDFLCSDPRAFEVEEISNTHNIDADPKSVYESLVGSAYVEPVYLLTAGENLPGATVILENTTTGDAIQWTGDLATNDELEIDVAHWVIKLNGVESMDNVEGIFPRLLPVINTLEVSGFGTTGTLQITYRNAYA